MKMATKRYNCVLPVKSILFVFLVLQFSSCDPKSRSPKTNIGVSTVPKPQSGLSSIGEFEDRINSLTKSDEFAAARCELEKANICKIILAMKDQSTYKLMAFEKDDLIMPYGDSIRSIAAVLKKEILVFVIPKTSDVVLDVEWQNASEIFADRFNLALLKHLESEHQ